MKRKLKKSDDSNFKEFARLNHLSIKNVINLNDKRNLKNLDESAYQAYLEHLSNKGGDLNE